MMQWFVSSLAAEITFSLVFFPTIFWIIKWLYDRFIKSREILRIISLHNLPSRRWMKGIYARDRFMNIYESKTSLNSDNVHLYENINSGAPWANEYIDRGILQKAGLVEVFEEGEIKKVRIKNSRIVEMVFERIKKIEQKQGKDERELEEWREKYN